MFEVASCITRVKLSLIGPILVWSWQAFWLQIKNLKKKIEIGEALDISPLVSRERQQVIIDALLRAGDEKLKPVKELLGDDYSYDEIRLVRAVERQLSADSAG